MADRSYIRQRDYSLGVTGLAQVIDNRPYLAVEEAKFKMASDIMDKRAEENKKIFEMSLVNPVKNVYDNKQATEALNQSAIEEANFIGKNPFYKYDPQLMAEYTQIQNNRVNNPKIIKGKTVDGEIAKYDAALKEWEKDKDFWAYDEDVTRLAQEKKNYDATGSITGVEADANNPENWFKYTPPVGKYSLDDEATSVAQKLVKDEYTKHKLLPGYEGTKFSVSDETIQQAAENLSKENSLSGGKFKRSYKEYLANVSPSEAPEDLKTFIYKQLKTKVRDDAYQQYQDISADEQAKRKYGVGSGSTTDKVAPLPNAIATVINYGQAKISPQLQERLFNNKDGTVSLATLNQVKGDVGDREGIPIKDMNSNLQDVNVVWSGDMFKMYNITHDQTGKKTKSNSDYRIVSSGVANKKYYVGKVNTNESTNNREKRYNYASDDKGKDYDEQQLLAEINKSFPNVCFQNSKGQYQLTKEAMLADEIDDKGNIIKTLKFAVSAEVTDQIFNQYMVGEQEKKQIGFLGQDGVRDEYVTGIEETKRTQ